MLRWWDRRRRVRRPWTLLAFGLAFVVLPFVNYLSIAQSIAVPFRFYRLVFAALNPLEWVLLAVPLPLGLGLLMVRKWSWYLLVGYAACLSGYNVFALLFSYSRYNLGALAMTVFGLAAVIYFVRRDIAAPYMKMYPRGWRGERRRPVNVSVNVDGRILLTRDLSERGLYVEWPDFEGTTGSVVKVSMEIEGMAFQFTAGVARVDRGHGVGLAFRNVDPTVADDLGQALRVRERREDEYRAAQEKLRRSALGSS